MNTSYADDRSIAGGRIAYDVCNHETHLDKMSSSKLESHSSNSVSSSDLMKPIAASNHHPDLPFLVTHWIAHYASQLEKEKKTYTSSPISSTSTSSYVENSSESDQSKSYRLQEARQRIRRAAKDLAWAFESLGEFGHSSSVLIPSFTLSDASSIYRPTTYSDLARKYAPLLSNTDKTTRPFNAGTFTLLDSLVTASSSATLEGCKSVFENIMPWSLMEAAYEGTVPGLGVNFGHQTKGNDRVAMTSAGKRLGESTSDGYDTNFQHLLPSEESYGSAMRHPILMGRVDADKNQYYTENHCSIKGKINTNIGSNYEVATVHAAQASRKHLRLRNTCLEQLKEIEATRRALNSAINRAETDDSIVETLNQNHMCPVLDNQRVIAQLQRRLEDLHLNYSSSQKDVSEAKVEAEMAQKQLMLLKRRYHDPYDMNWKKSFALVSFSNQRKSSNFQYLRNRNVILLGTLSQQYHDRPHQSNFTQTYLSILKSRLSFAHTISCHLTYPVYCLKFDWTGKYFLTGADDQLVKLFHLAPVPQQRGCSNAGNRIRYNSNFRGAVLVCTLRGHAGVVTDIDISADNALLATASADGDVRIWGLRDGVPVAILRGHKDGANMVSWSALTPYRLITCGEDGLARMWDVREAALKRCGDIVGDRVDYLLPNQKPYCEDNIMHTTLLSEVLSSVPLQQATGDRLVVDASSVFEDSTSMLRLHQDAEDIRLERNVNLSSLNESIRLPGEFIANDLLDEGVMLLAQLQHGELASETQQTGVGTRSRKKAVKVMCIARCPIGGHFATGSDDGLGRVWADSDDTRVEKNDRMMNESNNATNANYPTVSSMFTRDNLSSRQKCLLSYQDAPSKERLLATLSGHNNAITDMKYSRAGDRILTASMKDGVVRVWSWGKESSIVVDGHLSSHSISDFQNKSSYAKFQNMSQLLIRLTPVNRSDSQAPAPRRKGSSSAANSSTSVHCDGATWTCNDMKIVTSQSSPAKASGTDILPGSHIIYIWDSRSGRCLLGILGSHTSLCSTLVTHPFLPSVLATAGSDGIVNVWDLDGGECFFNFTNLLVHGPTESSSSRGKRCGFLEGQFSPDGLCLVLSDESGRVSVFDTPILSSNPSVSASQSWMEEQYFANDYYDLSYDTYGYCVERGSGKPPHIAPKGVRCTHEGVSLPEEVRDAFSKLLGPLPLSPDSVRWIRDQIRIKNMSVRSDGGILSLNVRKKATNLVESPGVLTGCKTTAIITSTGKLVQQEWNQDAMIASMTRSFDPASVSSSHRRRASDRTLSNRYRWVDFYDISDDEEDQEDSNDEDYRGDGQRLSNHQNEEGDFSISDSVDPDSPSDHVRTRRQEQRRSGFQTEQRSRQVQLVSNDFIQDHRPSRLSTRHVRRMSSDLEEEVVEELLSTHTKPSGEYIQDWTIANHFFKLPRNCCVHREWVSRTCSGPHLDKRIYCPQVGDSVVYIPRAHYDTLQKFPIGGYTAPWKTWPTYQSWPVVRCSVTNVRYRFPYEMYFRSRREEEVLKGVAMILTLEITGVPNSLDRSFPWAAPTFTSQIASRTRSHDSTFEVTMFECNLEDFIIPEYLYTCRVRELERAIHDNNGVVDGIMVYINYPPGPDDEGYGSEDPLYTSYEARLTSINELDENEFHFQDSGYNALIMKWMSGNDDSDSYDNIPLCIWDATVKGATIPKVPQMETSSKREIKVALDQVQNLDPKINEWFSTMIDTRRYSDYMQMIEVPMYLSLIHQRLRNDYYTNKQSVVADMILIKENCYKYNEDNNELYALACHMVEEFKTLVASIPDACTYRHEEHVQSVVNKGDAQSGTSATSITRRASTRQKQPTICSTSRPRKCKRGSREISQHSSLHSLLGSPSTTANSARDTRSRGRAKSNNLSCPKEDYFPEQDEQQNKSYDVESDDEDSGSNSYVYESESQSLCSNPVTRKSSQRLEQKCKPSYECDSSYSSRHSRSHSRDQVSDSYCSEEDSFNERDEQLKQKYAVKNNDEDSGRNSYVEGIESQSACKHTRESSRRLQQKCNLSSKSDSSIFDDEEDIRPQKSSGKPGARKKYSSANSHPIRDYPQATNQHEHVKNISDYDGTKNALVRITRSHRKAEESITSNAKENTLHNQKSAKNSEYFKLVESEMKESEIQGRDNDHPYKPPRKPNGSLRGRSKTNFQYGSSVDDESHKEDNQSSRNSCRKTSLTNQTWHPKSTRIKKSSRAQQKQNVTDEYVCLAALTRKTRLNGVVEGESPKSYNGDIVTIKSESIKKYDDDDQEENSNLKSQSEYHEINNSSRTIRKSTRKRVPSKELSLKERRISHDSDSSRYSHEEKNTITLSTKQSNIDSSIKGPSSTSQSNPVRKSLRTKSKPNYTENSVDDESYESTYDIGDISDEEGVTFKKRGSPPTVKSDENVSPKKKRSRNLESQKGSDQKKRPSVYPKLTMWPPISKRHITKVGLTVLKKLRERDSRHFFYNPVCEQYPTMEDEYMQSVKDPMDFRTIEEERLPNYRRINELQKDIILTFRNCCVFNGERSKCFKYTIKIWRSLNEIYKEACEENHVPLPPRFS